MNKRRLNRLLRDLRSPDSEKRKSAAEALQHADERAIYPLIKALEDDDPGVYDAALRSLISIGGEVTAYMTLPLLREHALLRNTALLILKEIGDVRIIRKLLIDKDDDVRKFGVDLLSELGDKESCNYLKELMKDPNPNVRVATAAAVGRLGCKNMKEELIAALNDDEWVCFSAIDSMGRLKDPDFIEVLQPLLDSPSEAIRFATVEALSKISHPRAGECLKAYTNRASDIERRLIIKGLIKTGLTPDDLSLKETLVDMLRSDDADDMIHGLKGLVLINAVDTLKDILDRGGSLDPLDPLQQDLIDVFKDAVIGLGSCESLKQILLLGELKYRAKVIAIEALGELGCKDAVPLLVDMLSSEIRDIRRAGVDALGRLQLEEAYQDIVSATDDPDGHVRRAAVKALGAIGDERAYDTLKRLLDREPYRDVKEEAVSTMLRLNEERFLDELHGYDAYIKKLVARFTTKPEILMSLIETEELEVRIEAIRRLGSLVSFSESEYMSKEKYLDVLKGLLDNENPEIRRAAVLSLMDSGYFDEIFVKLLGDTDMWVRFYAVKGIGARAPDKYLSRLKEMLKDGGVPVVIETVNILSGFLDREDVRENLQKLVYHPVVEVRKRVQEALNI